MHDLTNTPRRKDIKFRRRFIISPKFQSIFIGYSLAVATVLLVLLYCSDIYFFSKFQEIGRTLRLGEKDVYFQFIAEQRAFMSQIFFMLAGLNIAVLTIGGLLVSKWIAGPLYRLTRHMTDVSRGKTRSEVHFRKGDFFPELSKAYNSQLRYLQQEQAQEEPRHKKRAA